jgi:CMP-N-acetylneuraminic acid synthetase
MERIIALLPMKGTSERVPNKNLKNFNGKPLYHIILNTLLKSKYIKGIVINTDGKQLKSDILANFKDKVTIFDRKEEICGNYVSMNKIIEYDISKIDADIFIQTHSTNPLLKVETIDKAIEKMIYLNKYKQKDSVFSVTKLQSRLYEKTGEALNHNPEELLRTQDLEPLFEENSNFYIFTKESFNKANGKRIGLKPYLFEVDKIEAVDIDEPQDFIIAETLYKLLS